MNVNYEYYRVFYYAAKYQSLTKAADLLGSNQPNVSRCMSKLEQELGCRLLLRSHRGVSLTPEGELLFSHVQVACEHLQTAEEELSGSRGLETGSVSIGASETALHVMLLQKMREFRMRYPSIRLQITNDSTPQALAALRGGRVDFAVVTTPTGAEGPLREVQLGSFQEILVGGPKFSALAARKLTLRELMEFPLILLGKETMTYRFYERLFLLHNLSVRADTEAATADQILPLVKNDLGLGFLPEPLALDALKRGEVFRIPLAEPIPERHICMVKDSSRILSIAAKEFEKILCGKTPGAATG
ncbi:MAG: LysR family transcriptional regulator [Oscillibacter sp.]|nr:LysR family transcriptional regulator [Oscillibacter sp.]MDD3347351.1 LysR family transcriptional regulator [Oscillibacter sp.]